ERRALRPPEAAAPFAPAELPQAAAAAGARQPAGGGGQAVQPAPGRLRALEAEWGAAILARIARQQRYPAGEHGSGTARVALTVGRDGRLQGVRLAASSGSAALDRAALEAVRRAGRFPAAPQALDKGAYVFAVPMTFRRN
ncbi:MAG: TonB family protein, partial [Paracoccaceae bacterium]|nr:TonB family protein [Paracoccaceae bacterium]